ncbi:MAG: hypothetical protein R3C51_07755 [Parvularculaceae bacterium]
MSENETPPDSHDEPSSAAPEEVDAEIVEDGYGGAQSPEPDKEGADTAAPASRGPSKRAYIMIVAAAAIAAAGGGLWLATKPKSDAGAPLVITPAATKTPDSDVKAPETPTPAEAPLTLDIAPKPDPAPETAKAAPEKIFNDGFEGAKDAFEALSDAAEANDGEYLGMPEAPPADAFGNAGLQQAAKDAAKLLKPDPAAPEISIETSPGTAPEEAPAVPSGTPEQGAALADPAIAPASATLAASITGKDFSAELAELKAAYAGQVTALGDALAREREITREQSGEIARLNAELAASRARAAPAVSSARAALALTALTERALAGEPYLAELESAREAGAPAAAIAALAPHAQSGAPTLASLKQGFDVASRAALAAGRRETAQGPIGALGANLAAYVNLRPIAPIEGDSAPAVLSRAQERIDGDDIAGAAAEVQKLDGGAREAFDGWLADAAIRTQISAALTQANATVMSRLSDGVNVQ